MAGTPSRGERRLAEIIVGAGHGLDSAEPVVWAAERLAETLRGRGIAAELPTWPERAAGAEIVVEIGYAGHRNDGASPLDAEKFAIERKTEERVTVISVDSPGIRGLVYGLLELEGRVRDTGESADPLSALHGLDRIVEAPAARVRSVSRMFVSETEDKGWFRDRSFWDAYLTELASHRFNRFNLAFGMGYDYGHDPDIRDNYLYFAYPFLLSVPGYDLKAEGLAEGEAALNLEALRYIGEQAKRRGLDFQLGIWTNTYDLPDSPDPHYRITGLTPDNHAAYCRDALSLLLASVPAIDGLTLRVHYESGIPEPAHEFWRSALSGIRACERPIGVDIHSKGVDFEMIRMVQATTGKQVTVSPKYWAEHLGLPYHQAANREREMPEADFQGAKYAAVTAGSRKATRYGYADFLTEARDYDIVFRVWPGTQRVLLWGDPVMAAGFGRAAAFCGAAGLELFEPLAFKGRKTSGRDDGRELYDDESLRLNGKDWIKYGYAYLLWGRLLYNPDADPEVWRRPLRRAYGPAAARAEAALAAASRILPLVTVAHHPSSANVDYWPEIYTNLAMIRTTPSHLEYDLPEPKTFGAASPLDPALFASVNEYADDAVSGRRSRKVTPAETAARLDEWADEAERELRAAEEAADDPGEASFRRLSADVRIMAGLGRFFARKFRAGIAYALFERAGDPDWLTQSLEQYRSAREAWTGLSAAADGIYKRDLAFGHRPYMRGSWADRIEGIDADIAELERLRGSLPDKAATAAESNTAAEYAITAEPATAVESGEAGELAGALTRVRSAMPRWTHDVPGPYRRGTPVTVGLTVPDFGDSPEAEVRLHYRRVNQAERYAVAEFKREGAAFTAAIPDSYTDSPYPLLYFFELRLGDEVWMVPGFDRDMSAVPYFVLRQTAMAD
ncbi:hypothetical protein I8J29_04945 [Paenibacillus sp. MWE-103]|uniref:Uncharacterized protein n=1 Tax=Paenibacillus artemisiicola TaxID=1172618 RepID=A0ABS3W5V7_9BACL|nr:hypothetical protein [Paenibacillus artemisiicola]MBO7743530.1 hypothetical protein [Paenibacillus artemisiicola]